MTDNVQLYLALSDNQERSRIEDLLVLAGFDASTFSSPSSLWEHFQTRPTRLVIVDHTFADGTSGLEVVRKIRALHLQPYVYILVRSTVERLTEIEDALAAGANDCLVAFNLHDSFQIRSRILVGLQWLAFLDSHSANPPAADPRLTAPSRVPEPATSP